MTSEKSLLEDDAEVYKGAIPLEQLDGVKKVSQVSGNTNYHEKDGLRTEGDGSDHHQFNNRSSGFIMTVVGCAFALCGAQIYPLLYSTIGTTISASLNRPDLYVWMLTAGILSMGALAPFIGPIADMLGRKHIFLVGFICSIVGSIVCSATPTAAGFIAGQVFLGFGAVTQELLAIAVVAEIVPTSKRPLFAFVILSAIIPWSPGTLYANWMAEHSWRWVGLALGLWNLVSMVIIAAFYRPPPRVNSRGLTRKEQLMRIDFLGGGLITLGLIFFLIALNEGGQRYAWNSGYVIGFLVAGIIVMLAFVAWEVFGTKFPLYPRRIIQAPRKFFCMIFVIFAAGINYTPLVVFWPVETISVYQADLHNVGIRSLPIGICILGGAMLSAALLAVLPRFIHWTMFCFCAMQTVALACMVLADPNNIATAWPQLILALIGVGGVLVPNQVIITVITPDDLIASVTALTVGLRAQAQVIGLCIFYNQFISQVTKNTYKYAVSAFLQAGIFDQTVIRNMVTGLTAVPFSDYAQKVPQLMLNPAAAKGLEQALVQTFIKSFEHIWYITIAFGVAACIAAALMGEVYSYMDKHVAVVL